MTWLRSHAWEILAALMWLGLAALILSPPRGLPYTGQECHPCELEAEAEGHRSGRR